MGSIVWQAGTKKPNCNWEWIWNLYLGIGADRPDYRVYMAGVNGPRLDRNTLAYALVRCIPGDADKVLQLALFAGDSFSPSPLYATDSVASLCNLLGFLTLEPGDTDKEYFDQHTPAQLDWVASSNAASIKMLVFETEENGYKRVTWAKRVTL